VAAPLSITATVTADDPIWMSQVLVASSMRKFHWSDAKSGSLGVLNTCWT
jgi:hypothetical protein